MTKAASPLAVVAIAAMSSSEIAALDCSSKAARSSRTWAAGIDPVCWASYLRKRLWRRSCCSGVSEWLVWRSEDASHAAGSGTHSISTTTFLRRRCAFSHHFCAWKLCESARYGGNSSGLSFDVAETKTRKSESG